MNAKRQTVWLVSMLSLMVVLSAYYLFTEDVNKLDATSDSAHTQDVKVDTQEAPTGAAKGSDQASAASKSTQTKATGAKAADANAAGAKAADANAAGAKSAAGSTGDAKDAAAKTTDAKAATAQTDDQKSDAQVLQQLSTQGKSGADFFVAKQIERNEALQKKYDDLMKVVNESKDKAAADKAAEEVNALEDQQTKLMTLEDDLSKDYHNAIVSQADDKWQVVVQADSLDKSQALSILDTAMNELGVGPEKVTVSYTP